MLKFGNREFRNLQEQVLKNMCDIQDIEQGATVLAAFGIKVVGQVDQVSDLPAPTTYTGNLGDAFLVGTQAPYLYYIYAKAYDGQEQPAFYNLGQFPQPGPKGDQGDAAGFGAITATATSVVGQPTVSVNTSGTNEAKNIAFEFGIPDGVKCYTGAEDISQGSTYPLNTFEGIKVGDIVSDTPSGQVFIVQYVSNSEMNLYGIATYSQQIAVTLKVQNNMWVVTSYMPEYVEANPTASATGTLQKLKVNNTVYSVGGGSTGKTKIPATVFSANTDTTNGFTTLKSFSAYDNQLEKVKVGDPVTVIITHSGNVKYTLNFVCVVNELPFSGMGQHFKIQGSGYCDNVDLAYVCSGYIDYASSGQDGPLLYLTASQTSNTQHPTSLVKNDKVDIYF